MEGFHLVVGPSKSGARRRREGIKMLVVSVEQSRVSIHFRIKTLKNNLQLNVFLTCWRGILISGGGGVGVVEGCSTCLKQLTIFLRAIGL